MSDYDMTFDKKIVDDKSFDTIFGGEEDDHLLDLVLKEDSDTFNTDERDPEKIEDGLGKIGAGSGLGSDVGPNHDENKPTDDTSDVDILVNSDKNLKSNDQLNVSDTTGEKVDDGGMVNTNDVHASGTDELVGNDPAACERHLDDAIGKVANGVDGFDEACARLLEEFDELSGTTPAEEEVPPVATPPAAPEQPSNEVPSVPTDAPVPAPAAPVQPDAETPAPVAPGSDNGVPSDMDLLDTDPVDDGPVEESADEDKKDDTEDDVEESVSIEDLDRKAMEEASDEFIKDERDPGKIEDGLGAIGKGDGLGSDLGPGHDENKPTDDTSDMDLLTNDSHELKSGQYNVADDADGKVTDGGMVKDFANAGEDGKNSDDSFKEASIEDLEAAAEEDEDEIIDTVEGNKEKSEFSVSELNADDDDEILSMLN